MKFINFEAIDSDQDSQENCEEQNFFSKNDEFIDDESVHGDTTHPHFYRFVNQTRDPNDNLNCNDQLHLDRRDLQPEMYICKPRQNVEFDDFDKSTELSDKFKKPLCTFEDVDKEDSFFAAVLFGLLTKLSGNGNFTEESTIEILGQEFAKKLLSEKENLQLHDSFESFFDKCHLVNELLEEKHLF